MLARHNLMAHGVILQVADQLKKWLRFSAGPILIFTGLAKGFSALGSAHILVNVDPLFGLKFSHLMIAASLLELVVGGLCLSGKSGLLAVILVAFLATNLLAYRFGLWLMGWHIPCVCLGNFTDAIHVPPHVADNAMKGVLAYLLIGSYGILIHQWWKSRKLAVGGSALKGQNPETGVGS